MPLPKKTRPLVPKGTRRKGRAPDRAARSVFGSKEKNESTKELRRVVHVCFGNLNGGIFIVRLRDGAAVRVDHRRVGYARRNYQRPGKYRNIFGRQDRSTLIRRGLSYRRSG